MTGDVGPQGERPAARRRGRLTAAAALLLVGGVTAITVGLLGQHEAPQPAATVAGQEVSVATTVTSKPGGTTTSSSTTEDTGRPARSQPSDTDTSPVTAPLETAEAKKVLPVAAPVSRPVRLRIPAIKVNSELIVLGLKPDGTLDVPTGPDYDKAAWFDGSPAPGEVGPAVIEGHVDGAANGPSVFFELAALRPGSLIEVDRQDGSTVRFSVTAVRSYPKDEFPTFQVYGNTSGPELRLITCGGEFDSRQGRYRDNTVVFANQLS